MLTQRQLLFQTMKSRPEETEMPQLTRRKLWAFRLVTLTVIPLLIFLLAELVLRLAGVGNPVDFFISSEINGERVLIENRHFGVQFFPKHLARTPHPAVLNPEKPEGAYRIFVFGESAAMGDPDGVVLDGSATV